MCRRLTPRREQGSYNNPAFKKEALHLIATECNVGETDADDELQAENEDKEQSL